MKAKPWNVSVATAAVLLAACSDRHPAAPLPSISADRQTVEGPREVTGKIGPGALYALSIPANWNGDLVIYAHGYFSPLVPVALPNIPRLRDGLLALGFGVAYSSYAENGFAIRDGVLRTRQLLGLFASNFGQPRRTYLASTSMGAAVVLRLAEENPQLFDGVLPMCGIVGGAQMELDYLFNVRVLFDYFYPGVIPGDAVNVPELLDFGEGRGPRGSRGHPCRSSSRDGARRGASSRDPVRQPESTDLLHSQPSVLHDGGLLH